MSRFSATFGGYKPCHDAEQVIAAAAYDPEADLDNTPTRSSAPTVPATPSNGIKSPNSPTSTTPCEVVTTNLRPNESVGLKRTVEYRAFPAY